MVTNHEIFASYDVGWVLGAPFPQLDLAIPAGATLKRFIVRRHVILGTTNGANLNSTLNPYLYQDVTIVAGQYATRTIFHQDVALEVDTVGLYDVVAGNRIYSQLIRTGDERLGINQRCSYGTRAGLGFTVRYRSEVFFGGGFAGLLSNSRGIAEFRAIYETLP